MRDIRKPVHTTPGDSWASKKRRGGALMLRVPCTPDVGGRGGASERKSGTRKQSEEGEGSGRLGSIPHGPKAGVWTTGK